MELYHEQCANNRSQSLQIEREATSLRRLNFTLARPHSPYRWRADLRRWQQQGSDDAAQRRREVVFAFQEGKWERNPGTVRILGVSRWCIVLGQETTIYTSQCC